MKRTLASVFLAFAALSGLSQGSDSRSVTPLASPFEIPKLEIAKELKHYNFNIPRPDFGYFPDAMTRDMAQKHTYYLDLSSQAAISSWDNGSVTCSASRLSLPGLMGIERGRFSVSQRFGKLTLSGSVSAEKYGSFRRLDTSFGIHGSLTYHINDNISLTAFGSRYSASVFHSPAAMPYINQSAFGGYTSIMFNDIIGIDLGVQRTVNPWTRQYENVPIARLNIMGIGIDAGYLLKELVFDKIFDNTPHGPSIGPPRHHTPIAPRR